MITGYIMEFYFYVQDLFLTGIYWYTLFIIIIGIAYLISGIVYNYSDVIKERILKIFK